MPIEPETNMTQTVPDAYETSNEQFWFRTLKNRIEARNTLLFLNTFKTLSTVLYVIWSRQGFWLISNE